MAEASEGMQPGYHPENDEKLAVPTKPHARGDDTGTLESANFALLGLVCFGWEMQKQIVPLANACFDMLQSPHVSSETAHDDQHEHSSFSLFNASFDTISDTGLGLASDETIQTPFRRKDRVIFTARSNKSNMELPDLKHHGDDYSLGDISPIKMEYRSNAERLDISAYQPSAISYDRYHKQIPVIPGDWQAEGKYQIARSNPFFVIRSNRRVFESFKYKLSCLWAVDNYINISEYGGIRQYREKEVSLR
jgi:hypothetical protein